MRKINVIFLFSILLAVLISGCVEQPYGPTPEEKGVTDKGRVVFAITDAAADMGSVSSVKVTVDNVKVHSTTEGWVTASSTSKTYDLLQLKSEGKLELLAEAELKEGTYNQLRLDISKVIVTDTNGQHEAKLPSGELKINANLVVEANFTSTATFDFVADESLHITGNGKYILAPVLQVETREDAEVEVKSDNKVEIKSGKVNTNIKVGMDVEGNVGVGLKIPADVEVSIEAGRVKIGKALGLNVSSTTKGKVVFTITDAAANMGSVTSVKVTVDKIMVHSDTQGWVNVTTTPQTFDLLELKAKGALALMANAELESGTYNQIRLDISKVVVIDANGEQEAKLPSNELKIFGTLVVNANSTSTATFDFIANESLHVTGNGRFIMAPVIKLETKENADVEIKSDKTVEIKRGTLKSRIIVGMDVDGNVGVGRKIPSDAEISIDANNKIRIKSKVVISY